MYLSVLFAVTHWDCVLVEEGEGSAPVLVDLFLEDIFAYVGGLEGSFVCEAVWLVLNAVVHADFHVAEL